MKADKLLCSQSTASRQASYMEDQDQKKKNLGVDFSGYHQPEEKPPIRICLEHYIYSFWIFCIRCCPVAYLNMFILVILKRGKKNI